MEAGIWGVILDWNGTLRNDLQEIYAGNRAIFGRFGLPCPPIEVYQDEIGSDWMPFFWDHGIPRTVMSADLDAIMQDTIQQRDQPELFPDTLPMLADVRARVPSVMLVSGWPHDDLLRTLARYELDDAFAFIRGGASDKRAAFRECLAHAGITPEQALVVGDMEGDARAAHDVGIRSLICPRGIHSEARLRRLLESGEVPSMQLIPDLASVLAHL